MSLATWDSKGRGREISADIVIMRILWKTNPRSHPQWTWFVLWRSERTMTKTTAKRNERKWIRDWGRYWFELMKESSGISVRIFYVSPYRDIYLEEREANSILVINYIIVYNHQMQSGMKNISMNKSEDVTFDLWSFTRTLSSSKSK
jgi:hypothetical protein